MEGIKIIVWAPGLRSGCDGRAANFLPYATITHYEEQITQIEESKKGQKIDKY